MRHRITRKMLDERASGISLDILGHEHSHAMGGYHIGTYEGLVYSDPGSTGEWNISSGETRRETWNMLGAMLDGFHEKRKRDKAVFVPIIAEAWCASDKAEKELRNTTPWYIRENIDRREEAIRNAGDAGGRLASLMLTLRRVYGESEVDSWYRDAMAKRECLKG